MLRLDYREVRWMPSIIKNDNKFVGGFLQIRRQSDSEELVIDGMAHHVGNGVELEFVEDSALIGTDSFST